MSWLVWSFLAGGFTSLLLAWVLERWIGVGSERRVRQLERTLRCQIERHNAELEVVLAELARRTRELGASEEKVGLFRDVAERLVRERRPCPFSAGRDERRA